MKKNFFILFLLLIFVDICTKGLVDIYIPLKQWYHTAPPFGGKGLICNWKGFSVSLVHVENAGAAWGIFSNFPKALLIFRITIISCLLLYFFLGNISNKIRFAWVCILSGAVGNVIDFFLYGQVIDMIQLSFHQYSFPVFNVADSLISIGFVLLLLFSRKNQASLHKV